jgi:hypothetical protein
MTPVEELRVIEPPWIRVVDKQQGALLDRIDQWLGDEQRCQKL